MRSRYEGAVGDEGDDMLLVVVVVHSTTAPKGSTALGTVGGTLPWLVRCAAAKSSTDCTAVFGCTIKPTLSPLAVMVSIRNMDEQTRTSSNNGIRGVVMVCNSAFSRSNVFINNDHHFPSLSLPAYPITDGLTIFVLLFINTVHQYYYCRVLL